MTNNLILDSRHFCGLVKAATENRHIKKIKFKGYGASMAPFIKSGDLLTLKLVDTDSKLKTGDVVAITNKNWDKIIIHRIIRIKNKLYQTKGDNNPCTDEWFSKESLIGVITKIQTGPRRYYYPKRTYSAIIAFLSRTLILNALMLPLGRHLKKVLQNGFKIKNW